MALTTYQLEQEIVTLNMQIEGHAKAGYEKDLRIAELEQNLADHSAQAFSIGETYAAALTRVAELESQLNKALGQLAEVPKWQPIETAPYNEYFLAGNAEGTAVAGKDSWGEIYPAGVFATYDGCGTVAFSIGAPTHWMELPKLPSPNPEQANG